MEIFEEIEFKFYKTKQHMGDKNMEAFVKTPFKELGRYDRIYRKWIIDELLKKGDKLPLFFRRSGLRDKRMMAQLFLRMFYFHELQQRQ